ncbi:hypothetical protein [Paraurantiacibacter namhicola]|uniref:hypothetical protein n=1 Tax=Paraurantiacibacter namhicola TaxID=645517 RepID=UPI00083600EA|nr:hypothetical protein [Paraurantiacibacter namhicola]
MLAACGNGGDPAAASSEAAATPAPYETPVIPDHEDASWTVSPDGQAIVFGPDAATPLLTLDCRLKGDPPQLAIIRHYPADPDAKALFPVIGNGTTSRFMLDATLTEEGRIWEGTLAADDPALDVFTGPRPIEATLPGGGTLRIVGSRVPGEFVTWCRAGGKVMEAEADESGEAPETDQEPVEDAS